MNRAYLMIDCRGKAPGLDAYEDSPYFEPDDTYLPEFREVMSQVLDMGHYELQEDGYEAADECTDDCVQ